MRGTSLLTIYDAKLKEMSSDDSDSSVDHCLTMLKSKG